MLYKYVEILLSILVGCGESQTSPGTCEDGLFRYGDTLRVRAFTSGKFDNCDDLRITSLREDDARNSRSGQDMQILVRGPGMFVQFERLVVEVVIKLRFSRISTPVLRVLYCHLCWTSAVALRATTKESHGHMSTDWRKQGASSSFEGRT